MTKMLRTSERNLFKRCQWAWERSYQDRLQYSARESVALWFGTGIHEALEHWYIPGTKRGVDPRETFEEYVNRTAARTEYINTYHEGDFSEAIDAKELGVDMLTQYLDHYGEESHLEVISAEQTFQIPVKHQSWRRSEGAEVAVEEDVTNYVGTFDLVIRDHEADGKIFMWDHKTAKALGSANTQYLPLDDQAGSYWTVANYVLRKQGLISGDEKLAGIIYNYLVKRKADTRPRNPEGFYTNKPQKKHFVSALTEAGVTEVSDKPIDKLKLDELESVADEHGIKVFGEVSANQPPKTFDRVTVYRSPNQQRSQIKRIQNDLEAMSLVRNNLLAATKTPTRECGFCEFREICELDESGRDWTEMADMVYHEWEPYKAHENKEN